MMNRRSASHMVLALIAVFTVFAVSASAATVTYYGSGFSIPAGPSYPWDFFGVMESVPITGYEINIDIQHTNARDLEVLIFPAGSVFGYYLIDDTLVGQVALDGQYTFANEGADFLTLTSPSTAPSGTYQAHDLLPTITDAQGAWSIQVNNRYAWNSGVVNSWSITLHTVPEPASASVLLTAAFGCLIRRRW